MKGKRGTWQVGRSWRVKGTPSYHPRSDPLPLAQAMLRGPGGGSRVLKEAEVMAVDLGRQQQPHVVGTWAGVGRAWVQGGGSRVPGRTQAVTRLAAR